MDIGVAVPARVRITPYVRAAFEGDQLTYVKLDERTNRLANTPQGRLGVWPGDRVAGLLRNRLRVVVEIAAQGGAR